jgi:hypothetical protein
LFRTESLIWEYHLSFIISFLFFNQILFVGDSPISLLFGINRRSDMEDERRRNDWCIEEDERIERERRRSDEM